MAEGLFDSVGASAAGENVCNTVTPNNGAKRDKVVNQHNPQCDNASFPVGVRFMSNNVFWGNLFLRSQRW